MSSLATIIQEGFNNSHQEAHSTTITVDCDSCAALVINGVPCREQGCPNETHECHGCNEIIPVRQKYCSDCR